MFYFCFIKCSNGCGFTCQNPVGLVNSNLGAATTQGSCPDTSGIFTICLVTSSNCYADNQCAVGQKCCANGCGRTCMS